MVALMDEDDDSQFRAGQLMGRMQTLREVMARLGSSPMDDATPQAILETLAVRHHDLFVWIGQTVAECEAEAEVLRLENGD